MYCRRCATHKQDEARFCDTCGTPLINTAPQSDKPLDPGSPELLVGCTLDGVYRIDQMLSRGGTAVVYRGLNTRLDTPVAIKVLTSFLSGEGTLLNRFRAEAKLQAQLRHPAIVTVLDYVLDGNICAIVMEYVAGVSLDRVMYQRTNPMSTLRIKNIMVPVLDAIAYAHDHGIIHRDIKPSNILLTQVAGRDYAKVMDFGIAKVLAEGGSQTAPGAMMGTLLYMSPEQCKALKTVDERSDIYSLGVTLFQMATGMVPFYAESAFDIMLAHVQSPPPEPRDLCATVPEEMQALILKALAKDPKRRFQNAADMAMALEAVPSDGRISASAERLDEWLSYDDPVARQLISQTPTLREGQWSTTEPGTAPAVAPKVAAAAASGKRASKPAIAAVPSSPIAKRATKTGAGSATKIPAASAARLSAPIAHTPSIEHPKRPMTRLRLRLPTPGDWERFFDASSAPGGVFCPTSTPPVVGTPVHLEITFVRGPRVFVRGIVTWRRTQSKDVRTRAGAGVQVHPVEHSKLTYITGWAMGHSLDQRQLRRLPIRLRVTYSGKSARRINFTRDLNEHSLFIHSSDPLAPNTVVKLQLHPPGTLPPFELKGRVTRCVHEVEQQGMGVRLDFTDSPLQTSYEKFIKQLEEQFLIGKLPDDAIS